MFGGKITTYRRLAESALAKLAPFFPAARPAWTARVALPGGDFPHDGVQALIDRLRAEHPFLTSYWAGRLIRAYGTEASGILGQATTSEALGRDFGGTLTEVEVLWLMTHEYAMSAADVVWRRSKLGLRLTADEIESLDRFMAAQATGASGATGAISPAAE